MVNFYYNSKKSIKCWLTKIFHVRRRCCFCTQHCACMFVCMYVYMCVCIDIKLADTYICRLPVVSPHCRYVQLVAQWFYLFTQSISSRCFLIYYSPEPHTYTHTCSVYMYVCIVTNLLLAKMYLHALRPLNWQQNTKIKTNKF